MRSRVTRRMSVGLSASGEGCSPSLRSRARMKASIGVRTHVSFCVAAGSGGLAGFSKAQWGRYTAPSLIHCFKTAISAAFICLASPCAFCGIRWCGSVDSMRLMSSLCSGWPGTMASGWPGRFLKADSSRSRRNPALRISGSGPWQLKQLAARIGCTSWLKSRCCVPEEARSS